MCHEFGNFGICYFFRFEDLERFIFTQQYTNKYLNNKVKRVSSVCKIYNIQM